MAMFIHFESLAGKGGGSAKGKGKGGRNPKKATRSASKRAGRATRGKKAPKRRKRG